MDYRWPWCVNTGSSWEQVYIMLACDPDDWGGCVCVCAEGVWEISLLYSQRCYKLKTAPKKTSFF